MSCILILREFCALHVSEKMYLYNNNHMALSKNEPSVPRELRSGSSHAPPTEGRESGAFV